MEALARNWVMNELKQLNDLKNMFMWFWIYLEKSLKWLISTLNSQPFFKNADFLYLYVAVNF